MNTNYKDVIINGQEVAISNSSDRDLYFYIKKINEEAKELNNEQEKILKEIIS